MIEELQNNDVEVAKEIRTVFQVSYNVEADLLGAIDFPPLKRPLENFVNSSTQFFGYLKIGELAGIIEIEHTDGFTSINSLVVNPRFFRQGIARKLMEFVFDTFDSDLFIVETGLKNEPAKELYKKLGFKEVEQWDTDHGVRKIKLERRKSND